MADEASELQTTPNGTTEQAIVSSQPVTVTPATAQPVTTQTSGAATIEAIAPDQTSLAGEAVQTLVNNPRELAYLLYAGVAIAALVLLFSLYRWEVLGDPRGGEVVHAFGEPLSAVTFLLIGVCFQMARFASPSKPK